MKAEAPDGGVRRAAALTLRRTAQRLQALGGHRRETRSHA